MKNDPCWKGYEMIGTKKKKGKTVPNCVPKESTEVEEGLQKRVNKTRKNTFLTVKGSSLMPSKKTNTTGEWRTQKQAFLKKGREAMRAESLSMRDGSRDSLGLLKNKTAAPLAKIDDKIKVKTLKDKIKARLKIKENIVDEQNDINEKGDFWHPNPNIDTNMGGRSAAIVQKKMSTDKTNKSKSNINLALLKQLAASGKRIAKEEVEEMDKDGKIVKEAAKWRKSSAAEPDEDASVERHYETGGKSTGALKVKGIKKGDTGGMYNHASLENRRKAQIATKGPNKGKTTKASNDSLKNRIRANTQKEEVEHVEEGNKENKKKKNEYVANIIKSKLHPSVLPSLKFGRRQLKQHEEAEQMEEGARGDYLRKLKNRFRGVESSLKKMSGGPTKTQKTMRTLTRAVSKMSDADVASGLKKFQKEEEQLDELKKSTLASYIGKASHDVATKSALTRHFATKSQAERDKENFVQSRKDDETSNKMFAKSWKRRQGIQKAADKLAAGVKIESTEVEEEKRPLKGSRADPVLRAAFKKASEKAKTQKNVNVKETSEKDIPFEGPYRKVGEPRKDQYGNVVKNRAKFLAKKAMRDAEKKEVKKESKTFFDFRNKL